MKVNQLITDRRKRGEEGERERDLVTYLLRMVSSS